MNYELVDINQTTFDQELLHRIFISYEQDIHGDIRDAIYMFVNKKNKKRYIGQTIRTLKRRFSRHINDLPKFYFQKSLEKHGWDNFDVFFYSCPPELLSDHETFWIRVLGTFYKDIPGGYNLTRGGDFNLSGADHHAAVSVFQYDFNGNNINQYDCIAEAARHTNVADSSIHNNISNRSLCAGNFYWSKHELSEEEIKNLIFLNLSNNHKIPTYQYDLHGNKINQYQSIKEAAQKTNIEHSNIAAVIRGDLRMTGGFFWSDHDLSPEEINTNIIEKNLQLRPNWKSVYQYDFDGNFINTYNSIAEAGKQTNILCTSISACIKQKVNYAGNFVWSKHKLDEDEIRYRILDKNLKIYRGSKPVYRFDMDGTYIDWFVSAASAIRILNISGQSSHISQCANGKLKSSYGFKWSRDPPNETIIDKPRQEM